MKPIDDALTARAFASSWNNLPKGSVYSTDQFEDWLHPLTKQDIGGKKVLELGCGNGSLLVHLISWAPAFLEGVDLGNSIQSAKKNLEATAQQNWRIAQGDLTQYASKGFDVVYCIGVLHHLKDPKKGFDAVIRNVNAGGKFHCWVYAREGNAVVISMVDPLRKIVSRLPWWMTKYLAATPLAVPFFVYAKLLSHAKDNTLAQRLPQFDYCQWIAKREFSFFRHVVFDQLVTPQTTYISRQTVEQWLTSDPRIDPSSTYIIFRNGNSWKFGGKIKTDF
jgi:ubiquinone/menaquinone biosynthesis C-methylase UbiE